MRLSVIIPVYNGRQTLADCLQALQNQTHPPDEIIVVDDGSTDDSAMIAGRFGVKVLRQTNVGPAAARNRGAAVANGDMLLFTDADCAPTPDWVERMLAAFTGPEIAGAKGEYRTHQHELVARFVQQEYQDRYDRMAGKPAIDFVDTYSAGYRRELFLAAGGFDASFPTASVEDQEFSFRLAKQGHRLVYRPGAVVYHRHDRTMSQYCQRKYWIGYWKAVVTHRYPAKLTADSHTPPILKVQMGLAGLGGGFGLAGILLGRWDSLGWGGLAWTLLLLSGLPFYLKILRRDAPVVLIAPLLLFLRAWALSWGFLVGNLRLLYLYRFQPYENYKF